MFLLHDTGYYLLFGMAASLAFLVAHEIYLRTKKERSTWANRLFILLLGLNLTVIFSLTVSPAYGFSLNNFGDRVNLNPLQAFHDMSINPGNFWGNIVLFLPYGTFLVLLSSRCKNVFISLFMGITLSSLIEFLQLFTNRSTDIDDILLNTVGTLFGYILGRMILKAVPKLQSGVVSIMKHAKKSSQARNGTGSIAVLATIVLISVYVSGCTLKTTERPIPPGKTMRLQTGQPTRAAAQLSESINANNAYVWDVSSNSVIYQKNSEQRIAPASTAKMLTAITALEYCQSTDEVVVGTEIYRIAKDASRAWLTVGSKLSIRQLLDALLLPSGNDAAFVLATYTGRKICNDPSISIDQAISTFISAMNEKASQIGAVHSHFTTPDGYDANGQYTTAYDLAQISKAFLDTSLLKEIAASYRISDVWLSGQSVTYHNTNELINPASKYYLKDVIGLKTGKSNQAGNCLISCAYINQNLYICVVMGSSEEGRWQDSLKLYSAIKHFV